MTGAVTSRPAGDTVIHACCAVIRLQISGLRCLSKLKIVAL
jgi:hypothetical protein